MVFWKLERSLLLLHIVLIKIVSTIFFAFVRQKGGSNRNPCLGEINTIFSRILNKKIVRSSSLANCEDDFNKKTIFKECTPDSFDDPNLMNLTSRQTLYIISRRTLLKPYAK